MKTKSLEYDFFTECYNRCIKENGLRISVRSEEEGKLILNFLKTKFNDLEGKFIQNINNKNSIWINKKPEILEIKKDIPEISILQYCFLHNLYTESIKKDNSINNIYDKIEGITKLNLLVK